MPKPETMDDRVVSSPQAELYSGPNVFASYANNNTNSNTNRHRNSNSANANANDFDFYRTNGLINTQPLAGSRASQLHSRDFWNSGPPNSNQQDYYIPPYPALRTPSFEPQQQQQQQPPYGIDPFYPQRYGPQPADYFMPRLRRPDVYSNPTSNQQNQSTFHESPPRQLPQPNRHIPELGRDDPYLFALANGEFSSPSLPPINSSPRIPTRLQSLNLPRPLEVGEAMPVQTRDQRASKGHLINATKKQSDTLSRNSNVLNMPPSGRKRGPPDTRSAAAKRRRSSASSPASGDKTKSKRFSDVSPFLDDEPTSDPANEHAHEAIDLSNAADVPDDLLANKCDNRVKIGKFQCVICMDDASHLTVTHCGHLFCSECLHSALHIDNMKKTCPVCRTKVDPKEKKGKNQKSYYHLELKIMTANKKGKQPANSS
ncbi:hypothetical protein F5B19DRAFT_297420 [Rostrohypoxylon terebratum]|nr:hypothetical protein F5B19DRAFT_297420 [Rostrohypoxylon terebratum]